MKLRCAVFPIVVLSAFAQQSAPVRIIGTVESVSEGRIEVRAGESSYLLHRGSSTALSPGDDISASCTEDASGKLVASNIWKTAVKFRGVVRSVSADRFEVESGRTVRFYPATVFSTRAKDLTAGQEVFVAGVDTGGGSVDAIRVTIYNTGYGLEQ